MTGTARRAGAARRAAILAAACLAALAGCAGTRPAHLASDGPLAPCPASPNCVASGAADPEHAIAPLAFADAPDDAWARAYRAVEALPRTRVVARSDTYLHAESTSALLRFVDDLELQLDADAGVIAVRSASRLGYSDWGVNRRRVEAVRQRFEAPGTGE